MRSDAKTVHENGKHYTNGISNGTKPVQNGINHSNKAADYYLTSNDLHMRKLQSGENWWTPHVCYEHARAV